MANGRNTRNPRSELFKQLTKLFSGPLENRRSQTGRRLRRHQLDKYSSRFRSASGQQFQRSSYFPFQNMQHSMMNNHNRNERYIDFDQMEYCILGDTKIAVPGGYKTIKELAEEYGLDQEFLIYAYDHQKGEIVPALGRQARQTTTDHAWRVVFENGQEIIGTANHRLMLRDGTYRRIDELALGDSMMPFYRKDLVGSKKDEGDGYRWVYTMHKDAGRKKGWIAEHILMAEWIEGRRLGEDEVVHHIDFTKNNNNPENLIMMDRSEHLSYHQNVLNEQRKREGWWEEFGKRHSQFMTDNNPAERKDITFELILSLCDQKGFNQKRICNMLDTDPGVIKRRLRSKGFDNFVHFAKTYDSNWENEGANNEGDKNPRYDHSLTYQMICDAYSPGMSSNKLAETLNTSYMKIVNRIKTKGYTNFTEWRNNYTNHKVAKIEYYGYVDLYDLTVDGYKNFATDSVISHNTPEIASALDIYADEMTTHSSLQPMLNIKCSNEEIKAVLHSLYHNIMNIEHNLFGWCRTMCKYGDFFLYLDIEENKGVMNAIGLPSHEVERLEGEDRTNPNYLQFQWNSGGLTLESWQTAHFRILGNDKYHPYGTSVLEPARRIWRQLTLLEDAMMAYRIVRSPERRVFYIDVGAIAPAEVEQYMQKVITQMKRGSIVDEDTGRVDLRYNPLGVEEDFFIPVRGETSSKIESLPGGSFTGDIDDVEYLRDKLFSALKIPASYISRGRGADEDKSTLAQKDIRFARTIQRLQRAVISELEKVGIIHLYTMGFKGDDLLSFKLRLNNPSKIAELQELEHWNTKFDVAAAATEGFFSRRWVTEHLFNMSNEEFLRNQRELFYDRKFDAHLAAVAEMEQEAAAGALGGLGGDDTGMDDDFGDLGDIEDELDLGPDLDSDGAPPGAGDDEILLATPDDADGPLQEADPNEREEYTRPGWKGAIHKKTKGNPGSKARKKNYKAVYSREKATSNLRNIHQGYGDLNSLVQGLYEGQQANYSNDDYEEEEILNDQREFNLLIEKMENDSLEKKKNEA